MVECTRELCFQQNNIIIIYIVFGRFGVEDKAVIFVSVIFSLFFSLRVVCCLVSPLLVILLLFCPFCDDKVHGNWFSFLCFWLTLPTQLQRPDDYDIDGTTTTVELKEHVRKHMANNPF